ncbi:MAG: HipA domain-containing protein [Marinospirillum sp.]|uniref:HipA domain-containing protein n=1 Tax=Marinospirillum sp. TaxID=2183934 RepID=UPI0019DA6702|nr:HipA domain-containing protein [Marinospirillum sp.]MBE0507819.1 HipA domain-containing protein [Marinospirillum sp.]
MLKPMDKELTVQIHHPDRGWMKCATLHFDDRLELGPIGPVSIRYLDDYAMDDQHVAKLGTLGWPAAWMQVPLQLNERASFKSWPLFLMDMLPQGAAWDFCSTSIGLKGRSEANYLALTGHPKGVKAAIFLKNMAKAPIGNLRVRENLNGLSDSEFAFRNLPFTMSKSAVPRLYMAYDGGLLDGIVAGGDAPKVALRLSPDQAMAWVDFNVDILSPDPWYLVKLSRRHDGSNKPAAERDQAILRAEYAYYQELDALGFNTLDCSSLFLDESGGEPALWMPRFDRAWNPDRQHWQLLGVESLAAAIGQRGFLRHEAVLIELQTLHSMNPEAFSDPFESLVLEWLRRDLLNVIFGNTDNHARNTSFIKDRQGIRLAPIYDFAPMAADNSSIHRSIRWQKEIERGSEIDWGRLPTHLQALQLADADAVRQTLVDTMQCCLGLYERLQVRSVSQEILHHPRIDMQRLDQRLKAWLKTLV